MIECHIIMGLLAPGWQGNYQTVATFCEAVNTSSLVTTGAPTQSAPVAISRSCISETSGNRSGLSNCVRPSSDSSIPFTESSASSNVDGSMGLHSLADR